VILDCQEVSQGPCSGVVKELPAGSHLLVLISLMAGTTEFQWDKREGSGCSEKCLEAIC
jgi:hypothetical protein